MQTRVLEVVVAQQGWALLARALACLSVFCISCYKQLWSMKIEFCSKFRVSNGRDVSLLL